MKHFYFVFYYIWCVAFDIKTKTKKILIFNCFRFGDFFVFVKGFLSAWVCFGVDTLGIVVYSTHRLSKKLFIHRSISYIWEKGNLKAYNFV